MDNYDNEWVLMLDDDLFPREEQWHVDPIQPEPERLACGRLYCPFDLRGDGAGVEHGTQGPV